MLLFLLTSLSGNQSFFISLWMSQLIIQSNQLKSKTLMCSATFEMYNGCLGFIWNYFRRYRQKQTKQLAMLCQKHLLNVNFLFIKRLYKIALSSNSACLRGPFYECQAVRNVIDRALALCHSSFNYILLMRPNRKTVTVTKVFWRSIGFFHGSKGEFGWTLGV